MSDPAALPPPPSPDPARPLPTVAPSGSWKKPLLITTGTVLACCLLTAFGTVWWIKHHLYASPLTPVQLSSSEQVAWDQKLSRFESQAGLAAPTADPNPAPDIEPAAKDPRSLRVTSREINAFLAAQGVGEQLKIDLAPQRVTANFLLPIDKDAPLLAGTTLRIRLALSALMNSAGKLELKLDDVSLGGIPLPNAWLGDIKGLDLLSRDLCDDPTLQRFAAGIKDFEIGDGALMIRLNE